MKRIFFLLIILFVLIDCGRRKTPLEPEFVILVSPETDAVIDTTTKPIFTWNAVSYAYRYQIQIDDKNTFYTPVVDDSNITSSSSYLCPVSLSDKRYWWRVRARQEHSGWEDWSETGTFIVSVGTPVPLSPVDDTVATNTPTFTWSPIPNALKYRIQVDEYNTFYTPIVDDSTITQEEYTLLDTTLLDGSYFWRVRVKTGDNEWGDWSNTANFSVDTNPFRIVSSIQTKGYAWNFLMRNDTAYVAQGEGGLAIIDLTDEENPFLIAECDADGSAKGIAVIDSVAYLAMGKNGISSILFSDLDSLEFLYQIAAGDANSFDIVIVSSISDTSYMFVSEKDEGMWLCQLVPEWPGFPDPLREFDVPGYENGLFLDSTYLYIACGELGLTIVDISKVTLPEVIGTCDTKGYANDVFVKDTLVFIADGREGLKIINAVDISSPYVIGNFDTEDNARNLFVKGDTAFIADENKGLVVLDVSVPTSPQYLGGFETPYATAVWAGEDYAVISDRYDGIIIVKW